MNNTWFAEGKEKPVTRLKRWSRKPFESGCGPDPGEGQLPTRHRKGFEGGPHMGAGQRGFYTVSMFSIPGLGGWEKREQRRLVPNGHGHGKPC